MSILTQEQISIDLFDEVKRLNTELQQSQHREREAIKERDVWCEKCLETEDRERVLRKALETIMEIFYNKWDRSDCVDEWNTTAIKMSQVADKALEASK